MDHGNSSAGRRWLKRISLGSLVLIVVLLGGSALSNLFFSSRSGVVDRLTDLDKKHVAEAFHLRRTFGDTLWAGWGKAKIPLILYNEAYAFLVGCDTPSPGWNTVPGNVRHGGVWEIVPGESLGGNQYYRQRLPGDGATPQAFTVRVGNLWAASMTTKEWTAIKMGNEMRDGLPPLLRLFVPYRLAARIFLGLAMNTDAYICAIAHESFHAFQGIVAAGRLADGERALAVHGNRYPWDDSAISAGWKAELSALADALSAQDDRHAIELDQKFVSLRKERRLRSGIDSNLVNLERLREWEEGLGKYTELALWKRAAADPAYMPTNGGDSDFRQYKGFPQQWAQEIVTLRMQSGSGETRFYYSGMAQAFLLDRLNPGWRTRILQENVFLEDLLSGIELPTKRQKEVIQ